MDSRGDPRGDQPDHLPRPSDRRAATSLGVSPAISRSPTWWLLLVDLTRAHLRHDWRAVRAPKSVGAEDGETVGRRSGRVIFFPVQPPGEADACVACNGCQSIRHPHLYLFPSSSRSLSSTSPRCASHLVSLLMNPSLSLYRTTRIRAAVSSSSSMDTHTCLGKAYTEVYARANPRGSRGDWWEEADGRRRGARTWCAKIYGTGVHRCAVIHFIYKYRAMNVCVRVSVAGTTRLSWGWTDCVTVTWRIHAGRIRSIRINRERDDAAIKAQRARWRYRWALSMYRFDLMLKECSKAATCEETYIGQRHEFICLNFNPKSFSNQKFVRKLFFILCCYKYLLQMCSWFAFNTTANTTESYWIQLTKKSFPYGTSVSFVKA